MDRTPSPVPLERGRIFRTENTSVKYSEEPENDKEGKAVPDQRASGVRVFSTGTAQAPRLVDEYAWEEV